MLSSSLPKLKTRGSCKGERLRRLAFSLSLSLAIPRERVWWSESSKMMMIMMMSKFMLDECAGGCKGRLLIDIFDHTHCTNMMYCLQCRCHFLGSFAALSLLCLHGDSSLLQVCNPHTRCASPASSVTCSVFPLELHFTFLQVGFQLVFVAFPLSASFPLPWWKLGVQ